MGRGCPSPRPVVDRGPSLSGPPIIPRGHNLRRTLKPGIEGRESGLSGSPDIPDPPPEGPTDLRGRIASARQSVRATVGAVPRVIGLVWSASPILTIGLATATILAGIVPAATAYVAKLLIDAVVHGIAIAANAALPATVPVGPWLLDPTGAVIVLAGCLAHARRSLSQAQLQTAAILADRAR